MTFSYPDSESYPKIFPDMFVDLANPQSAQPLLQRLFPRWANLGTSTIKNNDGDVNLVTTTPDSNPNQTKNIISLDTKSSDIQNTPITSTTTTPTTSNIKNQNANENDSILIEQLTGGITNKLFQATHLPSGIKVLIRAYGKGTSAIIDRDREVATHMHLHSLNLAPPLYARFGNGLVYSFLPGKAIDYQYLSDPQVSHAIARRLSQWHVGLDPIQVENLIVSQKKARGEVAPKFSHNLWELLATWIDFMPETVVEMYSKDELKNELKWIRETIGSKGGSLVVAHCDLLAGNVIVPEDWEPTKTSSLSSKAATTSSETQLQNNQQDDTGLLEVSFIDYEYAMLAPRAFDLANHFMEWQGFDCVTELIPEPKMSNPVLRRWASSYIGCTDLNSPQVTQLLEEVLTYWGMPGFYWGVWSAIQSTISDIDFDYASYANLRLQEYASWKSAHVSST